MDFSFSEEQEILRRTVKEFAEKEIIPISKKMEEEKRIPQELLRKMGEMGLMGMTIPEEWGGAGADMVSYCLALEEISRASGSVGIVMEAHNSLSLAHIYNFGNEEQREKYVRKMASGEWIGSWALTEPNAGSDAKSIETTARLEGGEWVLNGSKLFITNGGIAQVFVVFAKTDKEKGARGISAFIVERGTEGFRIGREEEKLGLRASSTVELIFEDCRIPEENLLGKLNEGFINAMKVLTEGRIAISALAIGIARAAYEASLEYSKQRKQFGRPISEFQAIRWILADMAMKIEASKLLTYRAAWLKDQGKDPVLEASMAKLFSSEAAMWITTKAIQIHGGYGYTQEYPVERYFREAKVTEIYEGTSEVQRMIISREILRGVQSSR